VPQWSAEIVVGEPLAKHLLREQFPSLEARTLRLLAAGWDNTVWVVDEKWAFRFPRREIAIPLVEREAAVLPSLEPILPLAIPVPRYLGKPSEAYGWPFLGSELLPGRELGSSSFDDTHEVDMAVALGRFLRILHAAGTLKAAPDPGRLPTDPNGRADMTLRIPRARESLAALAETGLWEAPREANRVLDAAAPLPPSRARSLVHGDLHFRHVLVEDGRVTGVIDWGDVCIADPSLDLQLVWSFFSARARAAFLEEYGDVPREREVRARVLGLSLNAILALYGHDESLPDVERTALASLDRLASD
jgi:aminoglycoside phosphotransferase (APT) family kinase protein